MSLSDYEMVTSLQNMTIFRIQRTIKYINSHSFSFYTSVSFQNTTRTPIYIAPVEMYKKNVLVNFQTTNNNGERCIFIPSSKNDEVIIKYIFLNLWNRNEVNDKMRCWLFNAFVNQNSIYRESNIRDILNVDFEGTWANYFKKAMWKPTEPTYTFKTLLDKINKSDTSFFKKVNLIRPHANLKQLLVKGIRQFLLNLDEHFLQLVYLPSEYEGFAPYQLNSSINFTFEPKKGYFSRFFSSVITLWMNPLLINEKLPSFHVQICPPEGIIFVFNKKNKNGETLKISNQFFSISHPSSSHENPTITGDTDNNCDRILRALELQTEDSLIVPASSNKDWNKPYRFSRDCIFLYIKSSLNMLSNAPCIKKHTIKLSFSINNRLIFYLYWLFIVITIITLIPGLIIICLNYHKTGNMTPINLFSSFVIFVIGYGLGIAIDYTSRKESQRFILRPLFISLIFSILILSLVFLFLIYFVVFFH